MCVLVGLLNLTATSSRGLAPARAVVRPLVRHRLRRVAAARRRRRALRRLGGALSAAWDGSWDGSATTARPAVREVPPPPSAAIVSAASPAAAAAAAPAAARNCSAWCDRLSAALERTLASPAELPSSSIELHLRLEGLNAMVRSGLGLGARVRLG